MKHINQMNKEDIVNAIMDISGNTESGTIKQLKSHLVTLRKRAASEATSKAATKQAASEVSKLADAIDKASDSVEANDKQLVKDLGLVNTLASDIHARVWERQLVDGNYVSDSTGTGKDRITTWQSDPVTNERVITKRNGEVEDDPEKSGTHLQWEAPLIMGLVDRMIEYRDWCKQSVKRPDYDFAQAKRTFNTALRKNNKKAALPNVQVQGNETSGYYVRQFPESDIDVPFAQLEKAEQKAKGKEMLTSGLTQNILDSVTFNQALNIMIDKYIENGETLDSILKGLDSHTAKVAKFIKKAA